MLLAFALTGALAVFVLMLLAFALSFSCSLAFALGFFAGVLDGFEFVDLRADGFGEFLAAQPLLVKFLYVIAELLEIAEFHPVLVALALTLAALVRLIRLDLLRLRALAREALLAGFEPHLPPSIGQNYGT